MARFGPGKDGEILARGEIFTVSGDANFVVCRVWRDAAIDADTGARCALNMASAIEEHVLGTKRVGYILDVREAPPAFGPRTEACLTALFEHTIRSTRRLAIVVGTAMQELQYGRLCGEIAPGASLVTRVPALARDWVEGR